MSSSSEPNRGYLAFHRPRFEFLLKVVRDEVQARADVRAEARADARPDVRLDARADVRPRVLDVGPSPFTAMLRDALAAPVDTLGLEAERASGEGGRHLRFNLNDAQYRERWRLDFGRYDLIVFAEVIEHLFTAPELVLAYVRELLVPGGRLLLQTPNAASLRKRIKLALGRNPFERIRLDPSNPGHYREYTAGELAQILGDAGFTVQREWARFYFDARYARHERGDEPPNLLRGTALNLVNRALPPFLREGITILAART